MSFLPDVTMNERDALQLNALQLAYIGDSVWELIVRCDLIIRRYNVHHMHKACVGLVNAGAQASFLQILTGVLTETEAEIVRRGRNAHPKHTGPKNQKPDDYSLSTAFEALIGFLFLTGQDERIRQFVKMINEVITDA